MGQNIPNPHIAPQQLDIEGDGRRAPPHDDEHLRELRSVARVWVIQGRASLQHPETTVEKLFTRLNYRVEVHVLPKFT